MASDGSVGVSHEGFEISSRFRDVIEKRVARLESDAEWDEAVIAQLQDRDHIRRQMLLVTTQRAEALRMRRFLNQSRLREKRSTIAI